MSESHSLSTLIVWLEGHPGVVQFVFRDRETVAGVLEEIEQRLTRNRIGTADDILQIKDDYGRFLVVRAAKITAAQATECSTELTGQADLALLQAHANTKLQKRAQQDPMLLGRPLLVPAQGAPGPLPFQR
jgi:hypothetical protein